MELHIDRLSNYEPSFRSLGAVSITREKFIDFLNQTIRNALELAAGQLPAKEQNWNPKIQSKRTNFFSLRSICAPI
ncbi:MAG: hypothetical protein Ct9H90mP27_0100 [Gammaproteobacteria bacterium]|nr:MAG: hypothetical protein Ct9H90mP27_0100 [Gammaproteobacteria bacterium]